MIHSSDDQRAYQTEQWGDICEELEDYGLGDSGLDCNSFDPSSEVLIAMKPSGNGGWLFDKVIGGDDLTSALTTIGLL